MGVEIERKFLVNKQKWQQFDKGKPELYRQGYILTDPDKTIRIRLTEQAAYITIKGSSKGASRQEYEYTIPRQDAEELLENFCSSQVSKLRYKVKVSNKLWEVDEFLYNNEWLVLAEIELTNPYETFDLPIWIDTEVTGDKRYYNAYLSNTPYSTWQNEV